MPESGRASTGRGPLACRAESAAFQVAADKGFSLLAHGGLSVRIAPALQATSQQGVGESLWWSARELFGSRKCGCSLLE